MTTPSEGPVAAQGGSPGSPVEPGDGPSSTRILVSARDPADLRRRLQAWATRQVPGLQVLELQAPDGNGASSDTVLVTVTGPGVAAGAPVGPRVGRTTRRGAPAGPVAGRQADGDGAVLAADGALPARWAVRVAPDPAGMPQFPDYDMPRQAALMRLVGARSTAPTPPVLWVEPDPTALGAPFLVMAAVDGRVPPDVMPYPFGSWLSEAGAEDQRRLQDRAIDTLAAIHAVELTTDELARFGGPGPGTALRRHLAATGAYYRWVAADGIRSPLLERGLAWLDDHAPADDRECLSWGDSRIGNMLFDGTEPVAVLDWEMAGTGPPEIDLGWMVFCHWWFQDMAVAFGLPGMPTFMRPDDVAGRYEHASGRAPRHLDFAITYAAVRLGVVMSRMARRQAAIGEVTLPDDPDDTIMHRAAIEQLLAGAYHPWD